MAREIHAMDSMVQPGDQTIIDALTKEPIEQRTFGDWPFGGVSRDGNV